MKQHGIVFWSLTTGAVLVSTPVRSAEVTIISERVLTAHANQLYEYDVDAISSEPGDEIEYELRESPHGMTIDRVTGLIQWMPVETGNFEVEIRAQGESEGSGSGHDDQEYTLAVHTSEPTSVGQDEAAQSSFRLKQNYPNPFNPSTAIEFSIPTSGDVTLSVFNPIGQRITTLIDGGLESGLYRMVWDARAENNASAEAIVASGVYFYRLEYTGSVKVGRMMLVR